MHIIRNIFAIVIAAISFLLTFYSVGKLMLFLSKPNRLTVIQILFEGLISNVHLLRDLLHKITIDTILIILFVLQHSFMTADVVKRFWRKLKLEFLERSFYNIFTSLVLLALIDNWRVTSAFSIWSVDLEKSRPMYWTFVTVHTLAWILIYGGSLIFDLPEILGIKQVYYELKGLYPPMLYKSPELQRLLSHIRHPSFIGLTVILWTANIMTIDRLILAIMWTLYMYLAWRTEPRDLAYQKNQLIKKKYELSH